MKNAIAAFALVFALFITPAFAEPAAPAKPSKESLLEAWEKVQKENPYTAKFEKTDDKYVYNFETTIFPFDGKLKVLNLLIEKKPTYYYGEFSDYDDEMPAGDYVGIIEPELVGVAKEFPSQYRYSYATWERGHALYFNAETKKWYTPAEWVAYKKAVKLAKTIPSDGPACTPATSGQGKPTFFSVLLSWFPMILLIAVWVIAMRKCGLGKQKQVLEKNMAYMDKAEVYMAKNEKLLEEILQTLKQKQ